MKDKLNFRDWLGIIGVFGSASVALTSFVFSNFETKADAKDKSELVEKKLDRMETKIDKLLIDDRGRK